MAEMVHDVAVVGGGLIGAAAALGLAAQGRTVLLIEPHRPTAVRGSLGMDLRTLALSPASRDLLEELGVWGRVEAAPYRHMEVWEERGTRAMHFDAAMAGREELGWIVENGPLVEALWNAAEGQAAIRVHRGRLADVSVGADEVVLALAAAEDPTAAPAAIAPAGSARARLLIAADGAASAVREKLGVAVRSYEVGQMALATVVRTERPHGCTAYQRFLLDGPVALLPGRNERLSSVVWSQSPAEAERRRGLDDAAFAAELGRAVQHRLGAIEAVDRRLTFPLRQHVAERFNPHPRALLVGDAARVVHPLAGQGANLGLEDVRGVLDVLGALAPAADPGSPGLWRGFDRRRGARARLMVGLMGALRQAYAAGDPLTQWLRNTGVGLLDGLAPLKRQIMVEAMGLGPVSRRV